MIIIGGRQITIVDLENDPRFFHNPDLINDGDSEAYWKICDRCSDILSEQLDDDTERRYPNMEALYCSFVKQSGIGYLVHSQKIFYPNIQNAVIIQMTGSYIEDFKAAAQALQNSNPTLNIAFNSNGCVENYTWHHVENITIRNNMASCNMELLSSMSHKTKHKGGVFEYINAFGKGYGR